MTVYSFLWCNVALSSWINLSITYPPCNPPQAVAARTAHLHCPCETPIDAWAATTWGRTEFGQRLLPDFSHCISLRGAQAEDEAVWLGDRRGGSTAPVGTPWRVFCSGGSITTCWDTAVPGKSSAGLWFTLHVAHGETRHRALCAHH